MLRSAKQPRRPMLFFITTTNVSVYNRVQTLVSWTTAKRHLTKITFRLYIVLKEASNKMCRKILPCDGPHHALLLVHSSREKKEEFPSSKSDDIEPPQNGLPALMEKTEVCRIREPRLYPSHCSFKLRLDDGLLVECSECSLFAYAIWRRRLATSIFPSAGCTVTENLTEGIICDGTETTLREPTAGPAAIANTHPKHISLQTSNALGGFKHIHRPTNSPKTWFGTLVDSTEAKGWN